MKPVGKLVYIIYIALAVGLPWYFWGITWWVCLLVGIIIFIIGLMEAHDKRLLSLFLMVPLICGAPLWLYGYGGWRFIIYGLVVGIIGITIIYVFSKLWEDWEFHQRYNRIQREKRQRPDWTGKECMACGKPVPLSTKVGDYCPHCGRQFGRELHG